MIIRCEVSVHARPASAIVLPAGELQLPEGWATAPWGRTFDDAMAAIGELPSLYTEPDGSFAWNSLPGKERWQLSGCVYDRGPELAYVDLFGTCASRSLALFLDCLRGPETQLMVQLRERGTFLSTEAFLGE